MGDTLKRSGKGNDQLPTTPISSAVLLLLGDIADTTWRMFVPTLGLIGLGFWGDMFWGTKPWLTILGIGLGVAIAALLVKAQFKKIKQHDK